MCTYAELTVLVPVSQYVRVEAAAAEGKSSLESTASFLLSEWVLATQARAEARRSDRDGSRPSAARPSNLESGRPSAARPSRTRKII